jgi:TonB family protein
MTSRIRVAPVLLFVLLFGGARAHTKASETGQSASGSALPASAHKILTKDPEYLKLLAPPLGNDFLETYSEGYRQKSAEVEASVAGISDDNLRNQARRTEWDRLLERDWDKFRTEAEVNLDEARIQFAKKHRDSWFEVGHVSYDATNNSVVVEATPTAPIDVNFRVALSGSAMNQIYDRFRQFATQDIEQKTREYVANAEINSNCARNPDWCYKFAKEEVERRLRSARMVVAAEGDLAERRIDHLFLIDYDTESVLLEIDPHVSALNTAAWRFSVGLVTPTPAERQPQETPPSAPASPAPPKPAPTRLQVPAQVTAAAIVTRTNPVYPLRARAAQIQGDVLLHAIIDKDGKISDLQVLSGDDLLARSALEAVRQWRYKPMLYDGEPTEVDTTITVTFSLLN